MTFSPVRRVGGFLPLEDYGLIGDGSTAALVGRDGSIDWFCVPRFDSPALFCGLLDPHRGGAFSVLVEGALGARHRYERDSGVLVTEIRSPGGVLRITDALTLRDGVNLCEDAPAGRGELVRLLEVVDGAVAVRVAVSPRGGAEASRFGGGVRLRCPTHRDLDVQLGGAFEGPAFERRLAAGERVPLVLRWSGGSTRFHASDPVRLLEQTRDAWQRWAGSLVYEGPHRELVRRSAITLKLLDHVANGALVAAPTASLPEAIGGGRNWDYRYAWIRDAAFSVYAFRRIGLDREAWSFLGWVLDASEGHERPKVVYAVDGEDVPPEVEDDELAGYRGSTPVRWGNDAARQRQHDVYGEILDCAWEWAEGGGPIDEPLWARLCELVDAAGREWREGDHGIWEVRSATRTFTYSAALCQVAMERGVRIAELAGLPADVPRWRASAEEIRSAILERAWDEERRSLTEALHPDAALDASVLALPLRRVVDANHPKMVATVTAVERELGAGQGLLYRYRPDDFPDGLEGDEGAFLLCSFWLVDNLAEQGRIDEAEQLFDSLASRASALGLLPEQIDPTSGSFLGNYPQAFSHVGVVSSAVNLELARNGRRRSGAAPVGEG